MRAKRNTRNYAAVINFKIIVHTYSPDVDRAKRAVVLGVNTFTRVCDLVFNI